ncbi:MAG: alkaline phosphatase family protein [Myxococcota bacterium]
MAARRAMVIGLDCAPPALVFDRFRDVMPHVAGLMDRGTWGPLRSTVPPITVPAWTSMVSGRDPGELGLYGFRNRVPGSYGLRVATSGDVRHKRLWDWLGEAGKRVAVLFVPLTWPPPPVRGHAVSCFLWPGGDRPWTFPPGFAGELESRFGPYLADVPDFRSDEPERVLRDLRAMTEQHFDIARWVWKERAPDFLMMVEMGPDRLHHALWDRIDPDHPAGRVEPRWVDAARDYYALLDRRIGELLALAGDDTAVVVVSDHGARAMEGGVRINEWLRREGWLALRETPAAPVPLAEADVDWSRTSAWGEGGYYARIFLNVRGRDPEGTVAPDRYDTVRAELARRLGAIGGPDGRPLESRVVAPEETYRVQRGHPPDLMAFFGDLRFRSIGTVGPGPLVTRGNDRGPDGCNHDWDGIFAMAGGAAPARGRTDGLRIVDVARTVLGLMDVPAPQGLPGRDWSALP